MFIKIVIMLLQVLKAVAHSYPNIMVLCWTQVSSVISEFLDHPRPGSSSRAGTGNSGHIVGVIGEKVITGAIKVRLRPLL